MSRFFAIIFLAIIGISSCKKKQGDVMADIKKKVSQIDQGLKDLSHKQVEDLSTRGGGTIIGYYDGEEVKKIRAEQFTDTCRTFSELYFDDGMLIFVLEHYYIYNKPMTYTEDVARANNDTVWYDDKKTIAQTNLYYLKSNKLFKWMRDNSDVTVNSSEFINREPQLWTKALIFMKELKELKNN